MWEGRGSTALALELRLSCISWPILYWVKFIELAAISSLVNVSGSRLSDSRMRHQHRHAEPPTGHMSVIWPGPPVVCSFLKYTILTLPDCILYILAIEIWCCGLDTLNSLRPSVLQRIGAFLIPMLVWCYHARGRQSSHIYILKSHIFLFILCYFPWLSYVAHLGDSGLYYEYNFDFCCCWKWQIL